jgi:ribosome-associated toxin RatA of RatAB toxin-antitoxin module
MIVRRTALLPLPAWHLYDIIEAAENYPRFLPWCAGAHIVSRDEHLVSADLRVTWGGMNFEMRTRNPKRRPEYMAIHLERGPFRRFEGEWLLTALAPDACKVAFHLDYEFDSGFMTKVAGPVFKRLTDTMVEAFIQHALATPVPAQPVAPAVAAPAAPAAVEVAPAVAVPTVVPPAEATAMLPPLVPADAIDAGGSGADTAAAPGLRADDRPQADAPDGASPASPT